MPIGYKRLQAIGVFWKIHLHGFLCAFVPLLNQCSPVFSQSNRLINIEQNRGKCHHLEAAWLLPGASESPCATIFLQRQRRNAAAAAIIELIVGCQQ